MSRGVRIGLLLGLLVTVMSVCGGCTYMKNRGLDAVDFLDLGITFTKEPRFGVYVGFQSLVGVGYAHVDGKLLGMANRQVGWLDTRFHAAGAVLEGYEQWGSGHWDGDDPDVPEQWGVGLGLIVDDRPESVVKALNCTKFVHVGFIGVNCTCKLGELFDFILGWTTLDIGSDDAPGRSRAEGDLEELESDF